MYPPLTQQRQKGTFPSSVVTIDHVISTGLTVISPIVERFLRFLDYARNDRLHLK